jgi:uncharacterized membrane protein required for colicin V production
MNGITWLDCLILILLVAFTVRGFLRGTIAQVFAFLGLVFGAWAFLVVGRWLGVHWHDARPAAVFVVVRWLVAVMSGLAIAAVFEWWGDLVAKAAHDGPFGWLDRVGGGAIGAAIGLTVVAVATLALLNGPLLALSGGVATHGRCSRPLVRGGAFVTQVIRTRVPWGTWLHEKFLSAERRLDAARKPAGR